MMLALLLAAAFSPHQADDGWILVHAGTDGVTMSGDGSDLPQARKCLQSTPDGCLWIRRGGQRYIATDPAAMKQLEAATRPQEALGEQQAALGREQAALGEEQAQLGARQAELALRGGDQDAQAELGKEQAALARRQNALGERQAKLGREQSRLSDELQRTARRLIDELIRSGKAKRVDG